MYLFWITGFIRFSYFYCTLSEHSKYVCYSFVRFRLPLLCTTVVTSNLFHTPRVQIGILFEWFILPITRHNTPIIKTQYCIHAYFIIFSSCLIDVFVFFFFLFRFSHTNLSLAFVLVLVDSESHFTSAVGTSTDHCRLSGMSKL